jgi:hypothetical protein
MFRKRPTLLRTGAAFFSLLLVAPPITYSQQESSFPDRGKASATTNVTLCVPEDLVERDGFEHPAAGSKMDAFHTALRNFMLDHGDTRVEYQVRQHAFETFNPANTDPRDLMDEVSAGANCPDADYSYTLPITRATENAAPDAAQSAAQQSSSRDLLYRGWQYLAGQGAPKDATMAARLYADAAKQGLPDAMYRLAVLYMTGNGVNQDPSAGVYWFYEAAKRGHAAAQMELGFAFAAGNGVQRDDVAAFRWLELAAEAGLPQAEGATGALYETGVGVDRNESQAAVWFQKAADQGQIMAMFELGQSLRLGRGVTRNESGAMQWYQKSAIGGFAPAQAQLGYAYLTGSGTAQDYQQAAHWLTEAANQGEPYAQLNLGTMYQDGTGVARNLSHARALYARAASSPVPQVAEVAKQLLAALPGASDEAPPEHTADPSKRNAIIGLAALAIGGAMVLSLLSHSGSGDTAAAPPSTGSSWPGSSSSAVTPCCSNPTPSPPPAPHCHLAPVDDPFTIRPGLPPQGVPLTNVCD